MKHQKNWTVYSSKHIFCWQNVILRAISQEPIFPLSFEKFKPKTKPSTCSNEKGTISWESGIGPLMCVFVVARWFVLSVKLRVGQVKVQLWGGSCAMMSISALSVLPGPSSSSTTPTSVACKRTGQFSLCVNGVRFSVCRFFPWFTLRDRVQVKNFEIQMRKMHRCKISSETTELVIWVFLSVIVVFVLFFCDIPRCPRLG